MWPHATSTIPTGWRLCDGTGTVRVEGVDVNVPDMRDYFVVGAGTGSDGKTYKVNDVGGSNFIALSENNLPQHTHSVVDPGHRHSINYGNGDGAFVNSLEDASVYQGESIAPMSKETTGISISATGGDTPFDNRPQYFAAAFIIKCGATDNCT
eukprot:TRINITY_DN761_c0_g1_i6.p1 TRINITY_DN761_c0_g1~~TRINITY_DN761_c0_g1_i6.p1  ORF type:complete len:153 (-),score=15.81 TRINITY_DN761_c0_g1_i6:120-578(-)